MPKVDLVVRDRKDYPDASDARAALQPVCASFPYAGVWLQPGDPEEYAVYVFTTRPVPSLAEDGWELKQSHETGKGKPS